MRKLSIFSFLMIFVYAQDTLCILLNNDEKQALLRQHLLIKEIRTRLLKYEDSPDAEQPIEELLSQQCHKVSNAELKAMATIVAAYKNNLISPTAFKIAQRHAHNHDAPQCLLLASFWKMTCRIGSLEATRSSLFDDN